MGEGERRGERERESTELEIARVGGVNSSRDGRDRVSRQEFFAEQRGLAQPKLFF